MRRLPKPGPGRRLAAAVLVAVLCSLPALAAAAPRIPWVWKGVERVVAIGDIHGDYDNFVEILRTLNLVDAGLHWTAGRTHLVQTGDVMDKGTAAKAVFDLLRRLEVEAEQAGGRVHVLLGNHEEVNITGIALDYPGYVTVEQFVDFLPAGFRKAREAEYLAGLPDGSAGRSLDLSRNAGLRSFWEAVRATEEGRKAYVAGFNADCGAWLLRKNAVIKIDGVVFVHGGISEKYATWPPDKLNDALRKELAFVRDLIQSPPDERQPYKPSLVFDPQGPLWYRELALMDETAGKDAVDRILRLLQAERMVIAHTVIGHKGTDPAATAAAAQRFDDRVWVIDTGISASYGGELSALIIENGDFTLWAPPPSPAPAAPARPRAPAGPALTTPAEIERFLREARVEALAEEALYGRTDISVATLREDGTERRAVFKSIDRRRPHVLAASYKYEIAAYRLARLLGSERVPPVVERTVEGRTGSLQLFIEDTVSRREALIRGLAAVDPERLERDLAEVAVLEILTATDGRDGEDVLISTKDQAVYRVDFSEAFASADRVPAGALPARCPRRLFEALAAWDDAAVRAALGDALNADELRALSGRKDLIVDHLRRLVAERGEDAVLYAP